MIRPCFLFFLLFSLVSFAQRKKCEQVPLLVSVINKFHIEREGVSAEDFKTIRKKLLLRLDNYNLYCTSEDIDRFLSVGDHCTFVDEVTEHIYQSKKETRKYFISSLAEDVDLTQNDYFTIPESVDDFVQEAVSLQKRKKAFLKYILLRELFEGYELANSDSFELQNQVKARRDLKAYFSEDNGVLTLEERKEKISQKYLKAIANFYDPHTTYFSFEQKKSFDEALSKEVLSFGVYFDENEDGAIAVDKLIPGGAAWKTGEIHEGDILVSFQLDGDKKQDATRMNIDKLRKVLTSSEAQSIQLNLKKDGGQQVSVELNQEKEEVEANLISSFILNGDQKIGFIQLPGFYSGFDGYNGLGCANDVAKELMKLKREGVDGLILDLRYNGGGSMKEALELAGIFINQGPLLVLDSKVDKPRTRMDRNRGAIYSGPLAVMVNGASASASEIVSMILQDYNRALIVGGSTYGKATAQSVLPLDTNAFNMRTGEMKVADIELGFAKITTNKMYGVNLDTYQKNGVIPDVAYPYVFETLMPKESDEPRALAANTIDKKIYNFTPLPKVNIETIKSNSKNRVASDSLFQRIQSLNQKIEVINHKFDTKVPLSVEEYRALLDDFKLIKDELEAMNSRTSRYYKVENSSFQQEIVELSELNEERNNKNIDRLLKDIELEEAYLIIKDLITN